MNIGGELFFLVVRFGNLLCLPEKDLTQEECADIYLQEDGGTLFWGRYPYLIGDPLFLVGSIDPLSALFYNGIIGVFLLSGPGVLESEENFQAVLSEAV